MPRLRFQSNEFTPAEAERITGVSVTQQRNWRRYGYLPKSLGQHARFNPHQLAAMTIMQTLSERGIGPGASREISPLIGAHVIYYACLWDPDAFEDRTGLDFSWYGSGEKRIANQVAFWSVQDDINPAQFCVWYADGSYKFCDDLGQAFNRIFTDDEQMGGACIVIELQGIAASLLDRTERPLFIAELAPDDDADKFPEFPDLDIADVMKGGSGDAGGNQGHAK